MAKKKNLQHVDPGLVYWDKNGVMHRYESKYVNSLEVERAKTPVVKPQITVIQNTEHRYKSKNKRVLLLFWRHFKAARTVEMRIQLLRELAEVVRYKPVPKTLDLHRRKFDKKKHRLARLTGKDCAVCMSPANVRHHIVQLQNGGINHRKNLVLLCNRCHAEVHPWLKSALHSEELTRP
jgi:HNH endonuclease